MSAALHEAVCLGGCALMALPTIEEEPGGGAFCTSFILIWRLLSKQLPSNRALPQLPVRLQIKHGILTDRFVPHASDRWDACGKEGGHDWLQTSGGTAQQLPSWDD